MRGSTLMFFVNTNMRYNPRTDNAMDIDAIAKQCMDAVRNNELRGKVKQSSYDESYLDAAYTQGDCLWLSVTMRRMYYRVYLSSGAYTVSAADAEDAAWQGLTLSKDDDAYLIELEPHYDLKETILPEQLEAVQGRTWWCLQIPIMGGDAWLAYMLMGYTWVYMLHYPCV